MLKSRAARISTVLIASVVVALVALAVQRFALTPGATPPSAVPGAHAPVVEIRPLPRRLGRAQSPEFAGEPGNRGGPWFIICPRHPGGYCSDPYDNFDVAMARAESHRMLTHHIGVGVSTACPF